MSQKPPVNGLEWEENIHKFNQGFIKNYDEDSNKEYFLEVDVEYPKNQNLISEPNYHTTKYFSKHLMAIEMKKTKVKMNKPVYLGMSILDISTTWWCWKMDRQDDKRSLPIAKNKKVIGIFKDELGRKIIKKFVALRAKNVHT